MIIETICEPEGFAPAIHGMRNPMDSWDKSDSILLFGDLYVGGKDKELSIKLQKAGPEHCKHLRMIFVWADITAPRYWWNEFDTYRNGVEKVSCSTMHKLMARPLSINDFASDENENELRKIVDVINGKMKEYNETKDETKKKKIWRQIIQLLPQSYMQKRTVCMSYAALRNIIRQRKGHKLNEWACFIDWVYGLKNSWMITDEL